MDDQKSCVFCGRPVAGDERCPLLPSSHWACCACAAAESAEPAGSPRGPSMAESSSAGEDRPTAVDQAASCSATGGASQAQQAQWLLGSSGQRSSPATGRPQKTQLASVSMGGKVLLVAHVRITFAGAAR